MLMWITLAILLMLGILMIGLELLFPHKDKQVSAIEILFYCCVLAFFVITMPTLWIVKGAIACCIILIGILIAGIVLKSRKIS